MKTCLYLFLFNQRPFFLLHVDEGLLAAKSKVEAEQSSPSLPNPLHHRSRREVIFQGAQSYPRYVEVMVTVDKTMLDHYGSEFELKRYIQTIMGVVSSLY